MADRERRPTGSGAGRPAALDATVTRVEVETDRGVFMISVAAKLANMHPQTLRMYEARGLIEPQRSPKGTRLYSHEDVEKLRRIQEMTADLGLNLAGVERVLDLEEEIEGMHARIEEIEAAGAARAGAPGRGARGGAPLLPRRACGSLPRRRGARARRRRSTTLSDHRPTGGTMAPNGALPAAQAASRGGAEPARALRPRPDRDRRAGQARSGDRPRRRDPPRDPGAQPRAPRTTPC